MCHSNYIYDSKTLNSLYHFGHIFSLRFQLFSSFIIPKITDSEAFTIVLLNLMIRVHCRLHGCAGLITVRL